MRKILILLLLPVLFGFTPVILSGDRGQGGVTAASGGSIGCKSETSFIDYWSGTATTQTSAFVTLTPGTIRYIYFDENNASTNKPDMTYGRAAVWASDGTIIQTSACPPDKSGDVFRWTLDGDVTLVSDVTYKIGFHTADTDFRIYVVNTDGSLVRDSTSKSAASCTASESTITDDVTLDADDTMRIWGSNNANDY